MLGSKAHRAASDTYTKYKSEAARSLCRKAAAQKSNGLLKEKQVVKNVMIPNSRL